MNYMEKMEKELKKYITENIKITGLKFEKDEIKGTGIKFKVSFLNTFDFIENGLFSTPAMSDLVDIKCEKDTVDFVINRNILNFITFANVMNDKEFNKCLDILKENLGKYFEGFGLFARYLSGNMDEFEKTTLIPNFEATVERGIVFKDFMKGSVRYNLDMLRMMINNRCHDHFEYPPMTIESDDVLSCTKELYKCIGYLTDGVPMYIGRRYKYNKNISELIHLVRELRQLYHDKILVEAVDKYPELAEHLANDVVIHFENSANMWGRLNLLSMDDMDTHHRLQKMRASFFSLGSTTFAFNDTNKYNIEKIHININIDNMIRHLFMLSENGIDYDRDMFIKRMTFTLKHELGHAIWTIKMSQNTHDECLEWIKNAKKIVRLEAEKNESRKDDEKLHWLYMYYAKNPTERKANEMMDITIEDVYEAYRMEIPSNVKKLMMTETNEDIEKEQLKMLAASEE